MSAAAHTSTLIPSPPTPTITPQPPATPTPVPPSPTATAAQRPCTFPVRGRYHHPGWDGRRAGSRVYQDLALAEPGLCAWTTGYGLVFSNGDSLNAPAGVDLPGTVQPGQQIDLSVVLAAPRQVGSYRGYWKLRDAGGSLFGLGPRGGPFYVDIKVQGTEGQTPLDFVIFYCQARWTSGVGDLPCPGEANDSRGFVRRIDKPTLENGYVEEEPALLTNPQMITDGLIRGKYPSVTVGMSDHFAAIIGCAYKADACDVIFQLDYQIGDC